MWLPKYHNTDTVLTREAADRVEYIHHETTDEKGYSKPDCSVRPRSPVFGSLPKHSLVLPLLAGSTTVAHGSTTTATPPHRPRPRPRRKGGRAATTLAHPGTSLVKPSEATSTVVSTHAFWQPARCNPATSQGGQSVSELTKTLGLRFVEPNVRKHQKFRETRDVYQQALQTAFAAGCDTQSAVKTGF